MFTLIFKAKSLSQLPAADIHDNSRSACVCVCVWTASLKFFVPSGRYPRTKMVKVLFFRAQSSLKKDYATAQVRVMLWRHALSDTHTRAFSECESLSTSFCTCLLGVQRRWQQWWLQQKPHQLATPGHTHTHELSKPPRRQHLASSLHSLGQWPLTLGTT